MKFKQVLTEAPMNLTHVELTRWNVEQMKLWDQLKDRYDFLEFAKKFDELFRSIFQTTKSLPPIDKMLELF